VALFGRSLLGSRVDDVPVRVGIRRVTLFRAHGAVNGKVETIDVPLADGDKVLSVELIAYKQLPPSLKIRVNRK
jgi:hypothetical protein